MTQLSKLIKMSGAANILSAVLLLLFWFLFALLMPYQDLPTAQTLAILVKDSNWLFVNLLGVQGAMVGLAGFIGLHVWQIEDSGGLGLVGLISGFIGLVMLTAQLMWEAFIWKVLIADYSDIFEFSGPLYSSPLFLGVAITAGLLFTVGFILTGLMLNRREPTLRIAAAVDSRTLWYTLYSPTTGQVEVDLYLSSSLTETGEYTEQRSEIFSFLTPERIAENARVGLTVP